VKDFEDDARDTLTWSWSRGAQTASDEFGNPVTGSSSYAICVYDTTAGHAALVSSITATAASTCGTAPCWGPTRKGFRHLERTASGGLRISLSSGAEGRASIRVKAKGNRLPLPSPASSTQLFHQDPTFTVQIVRTDGGPCWGATYSMPAARHTAERFVDKLP
jgi:hypothetical protein